MKCTSCLKETSWLEMIGSDYICHRCMQKNRQMGFLFRTNTEAFRRVIKKSKPNNYSEYLLIDDEKIKSIIDLKKFDI